MEATDSSQPAPLMKLSRYRSVRKAAVQQKTAPPPPIPDQKDRDEPLSPNRMRGDAAPAQVAVVSSRVNAQSHDQTVLTTADDPSAADARQGPGSSPRKKPLQTPEPLMRTSTSAQHGGLSGGRESERERRSRREGQRSSQTHDALSPDQDQQEREMRDAFLKRQKRRELERLERELSEAVPASSTTPSRSPISAAFSRRRRGTVTPPASSSSDHSTPSHRRDGQKAQGIRPVTAGRAPGIDAPVSAVNAGERRVKIRFGETYINLPVLPSTTVVDLIRAAAHYITQPIEPENSSLLELFAQLGLERRLRRYERIRDILNSWGRDTQNSLILISPALKGQESDLESGCAPRQQPGGMTVRLYHSQAPGKWNKRWITLRSDGQMTMSKKESSRPKDLTNICHLSDFDIYNITPKHLSKVVRPPRKQCFAVKSQQKSSMFLSTENFVHFFATDDKAAATQWYKAIQDWRSWYLVNMLGEGQGKTGSSERTNSLASASRQLVGNRNGKKDLEKVQSPSGQGLASTGKFPKLLAEDFQYTTDIVTQGRPRHAADVNDTRVLHAINMSMRGHRAPPVSFPLKLNESPPISAGRQREVILDQSSSRQEIQETTFAPTSLLGRTYSLRQKVQQDHDLKGKQAVQPTDGPVLENGASPARPSKDGSGPLNRANSIRSVKQAPARLRNASQGQKTKPLLDFSNPEFREPPQHLRKGRAYVPPQPLAGGLIDAATSLEDAIVIPPSTAWRRPDPPISQPLGHDPPTRKTNIGGGGERSLGRSGSRRGGTGHITATTGKGSTMTSDRHAKGPMLDLTEASKFVPGSLLARAERERIKEGGPVPERRDPR